MATWDQLKEYIHANYQAREITHRALELLFNTPNNRTQLVFVSSLEDPDGAHWASIDSPIGQLGTIDVNLCLRVVADLVCGGLAHLQVAGGDYVVIRHSVPLEDLDANEFDKPLRMVTVSADQMEQALSGGRDDL